MKMTEDKLKALTDQEIKQSLGYGSGELTKNRQKALEYYYAKPIGDLAPPSIDGRSAVVDTSVMDTVEWMLPSLLKIFAGGDKVVEFQAKSEQFEEQEDHITEYIGRHVFYVQNQGFKILHTWFKDALLAKNGIVKVWWDKTSEEAREDYVGLDDIELGMLLQDKHVEPIEHSASVDPLTGQQLHDISVKRVADKGYCCIENVPPEEFLISRRAKNCEDSPFVAHRFERTIGELKEAGYENVDNISSDENDGAFGSERVSRKMQNDESPYLGGRGSQENGDPASRVVWVTECYLKVDYDGDGIQEWRKVVRAGNQILENVECDGQPFISLTPIPIPHQFFGLSIADLSMEAQRTKTSLMRALIDNLYLTVNGRTWALEGQVNLDDLLTSRPGGIVRVKSPGAVGPMQAGGGDLTSAMSMLDYVDTQRGNRTGFTAETQGGNMNAVNHTATGMNIVTNRADMRIELIARNFAENGVKSLFIKILELVSKYQDKAERIKATGGWIDMDPREWKNQFHLNVNVGLGTGNKDQIIQNLTALGAAMGQAASAGVVKPDNVYKAGVKLAETLGFSNPEQYFTDPATQPPPEPKPDPQIETAHAMMEIERLKTEAKIKQDQQKLEADIQMKREELAAKYGLMTEEINHKVILAQQANNNGLYTRANLPQAASGIPDQQPPIPGGIQAPGQPVLR